MSKVFAVRANRLTKLRLSRLEKARSDLIAAKAAVADAESRLHLAKVTLSGRKTIRARAHRRLYLAMLNGGVNARGLEALDAAFETHDADIARAEEGVTRAEQACDVTGAACEKAQGAVAQRQKECDIWAEALGRRAHGEAYAAKKIEDRSNDAVTELAALRVTP